MGVERWIDQQLHPEKIDDSALVAKLSALPAMRLSTEELIRRYPPPQVIRQIDAGQDSRCLAILSSARFTRMRLRITGEQRMKKAARRPSRWLPRCLYDQFNNDEFALCGPSAPQRWNAVLGMPPGKVRPLVQQMTAAERQQLVAGMTPEQKEMLLALVEPGRVVTEELQEEKLLRATYSERQLDEVMTNFWSNHFNIYLRKNGEMPWYLADYERDVIRPRAMGRFEDLLVAVAHSPAMLVYLDNQQSIGPHSIAAMRASANPDQKKAAAGLNENYARELMELHTLGVNGGYTQRDVVEMAKVLTGWGVEGRQQGYGFQFNERRHEPGTKLVLGHTIQENGEAEGEEMLHILAESQRRRAFSRPSWRRNS